MRTASHPWRFEDIAFGDLPAAIDANLQVLERQPTNVGAMRNLVLLYRDANQPTEAMPWLEKALELDGGNVKVYQLLARFWARDGRMDRAQATLKRGQRMLPKVAALHCMEGKVLRKLGKAKQAMAAFSRCLALSPPHQHQRPLLLMAMLEVSSQRCAAAKRLLERAKLAAAVTRRVLAPCAKP